MESSTLNAATMRRTNRPAIASSASDKTGKQMLKSAIQASNATVRRLSNRTPGAPLSRHASTLPSATASEGIVPLELVGKQAETLHSGSLHAYEQKVIADSRTSIQKSSSLRSKGGASAIAMQHASIFLDNARQAAVTAQVNEASTVTGLKSSLLALQTTADLGLALSDSSSARISRALAGHGGEPSMPVLGLYGDVTVYHPTLPLVLEESTRLKKPLGAVSFVSGPVTDRRKVNSGRPASASATTAAGQPTPKTAHTSMSTMPSMRSLPATPPAPGTRPGHALSSPGAGVYTRYSEPVRVPVLRPATVYHMGRVFVPGDAAAQERSLAAADPHAPGAEAAGTGEASITHMAFVKSTRGEGDELSRELASLLAHPTSPLAKRRPFVGTASATASRTRVGAKTVSAATGGAGVVGPLTSPIVQHSTTAGSSSIRAEATQGQTQGQTQPSQTTATAKAKKTVTIVEDHVTAGGPGQPPVESGHHASSHPGRVTDPPPYRIPHAYKKSRSGQIVFSGQHRAVARPAPVPFVGTEQYLRGLEGEDNSSASVSRRHGMGGVRILTLDGAGSNVAGVARGLAERVTHVAKVGGEGSSNAQRQPEAGAATDARRHSRASGHSSHTHPTTASAPGPSLPFMSDRLLSTLPSRTSMSRLTGHPTPLVKVAAPAPEIVTVDGQTDVDELMLSAHAQAARQGEAASALASTARRGVGAGRGLEASDDDFALDDADPLAMDAAARIEDEHARAISTAVAYTSIGLPVPVPYRPGKGHEDAAAELGRDAFRAAQRLRFAGDEEAGKRLSAELAYLEAAFLDRRARPSSVLAPGLAAHRPGHLAQVGVTPEYVQEEREGRQREGAAAAIGVAEKEERAPLNHLDYDLAVGEQPKPAQGPGGKGGGRGQRGGREGEEDVQEEQGDGKDDDSAADNINETQKRRLVRKLAAQESARNPWSLRSSVLSAARPLPVGITQGGAIKIGQELTVPVAAAKSMAELVQDEPASATVVAGLVLHGSLEAQRVQGAAKAFAATVKEEKQRLHAALAQHEHRAAVLRGHLYAGIEGVMTLHGGREGVHAAMTGLGPGVAWTEAVTSRPASALPFSPLRVITREEDKTSSQSQLGLQAEGGQMTGREAGHAHGLEDEDGIPEGLTGRQRAAWKATKERARKLFSRPVRPPPKPEVTVNLGGHAEVLGAMRDTAEKAALLDLHDTHCAVHEALSALVSARPGGLDSLDRAFISLLHTAVLTDAVLDRPRMRRMLLQLQEAVQQVPDEELPCSLVHDPVHGLGVRLPDTSPRPHDPAESDASHHDGLARDPPPPPVPGALYGPKVRFAEGSEAAFSTLRATGWSDGLVGGTLSTTDPPASGLLSDPERMAALTRRCWPVLLAEPLGVLLAFTGLSGAEYESFLCLHGLAVPLVGPVSLPYPSSTSLRESSGSALPAMSVPTTSAMAASGRRGSTGRTSAVNQPSRPLTLPELCAYLHSVRSEAALRAKLDRAKEHAREQSLALLKQPSS